MTGFDETVPPVLDPNEDATSAEDVGDNVVDPKKLEDSAGRPNAGDDDLTSGHYGPTADGDDAD